MMGFLVRVAVLVLALYLAYALVTGQYTAVKRHYSWMHPDPRTVR